MTESFEALAVPGSDRLERIAIALKMGEASPVPTVREFLGWFGAMRRGYYVVRGIQASLEAAHLATDPDFAGAYIDAPISFAVSSHTVAASGPVAEITTVADETPVAHLEDTVPVSVGIADPTYRLSKLAAANRTPVSVSPDRPVMDAVTLMLSNDFSQLPVMTSERSVKGMISWRSVGARWALGKGGDTVRDFIDEAFEISADRSIFSALPTITEQGYVLVRDATAKVVGIVTTSDLSLQFQQLAEPFLLIGEIENQIRRLMDGRFTKDELAHARDPADSVRTVENVADLTLGECLRFLQEPARWEKLGVTIDRAIFVKDLSRAEPKILPDAVTRS